MGKNSGTAMLVLKTFKWFIKGSINDKCIGISKYLLTQSQNLQVRITWDNLGLMSNEP